ncbi:GNAT family N-acetyltransferase [Pseudovibrio exalbescens]|nr:GNAT family N-acetyltransferase [Pseudovibrio exalbescens]
MHRSKASWGYQESDMAQFRADWAISSREIMQGRAFIAMRADQIAGFATGHLEDCGAYVLDHLFVEPMQMRTGIGSWLLEVVLEDAKTARASRLRLESDPHAVGFYQAHGFATTQQRPSAFQNTGNLHIMEKPVMPEVQVLNGLNLKLLEAEWAFENDHKSAIATHWQKVLAEKPKSWNGTVFKALRLTTDNGLLTAEFSRCQYASFLAWRDWGYPDITVKNVFGCAALRSQDGTVILGQMASHTSTGGQVYFPGGNLDEQDLQTDGTIDVLGSIRRELQEETGISPNTVEPGRLFLISDGPRVCVAQEYVVPMASEDIRTAILNHNKTLEFPELDDVILARIPEALRNHVVPPYAASIVKTLLNRSSTKSGLAISRDCTIG